ncbi:MAG: TIGR03826 family flagellar region protein [Bacillus sp. (in: firmicutes)]
MAEIANCPNCSEIFFQSKYRDVCEKCYKQENEIFDVVYQYIRKKENRTAKLEQVLEDTGAPEELLIKFIKTGRLRLSRFPNLSYKCDQCGASIREGKLCSRCREAIMKELKAFEEEERRRTAPKRDQRNTYHINESRNSLTDHE